MNCVLALLAVTSLGLGEPNDVIQAIDQAQLTREDQLISYSVTEHYTLRNARFGTAAELVAKVTYTRNAGKVYQVVSRTGSAMMQSRILDRVLAEETQMSQGETRNAALVTSANYVMRPRGEQTLNGRRCILLEITPRRKSSHLIKGQLWVDARNRNIVRIEGTPSESPSFWAGMPKVYRDYADIGELSFAQKSVAVSGSMLLGKTEMVIEYSGYEVNVENQ